MMRVLGDVSCIGTGLSESPSTPHKHLPEVEREIVSVSLNDLRRTTAQDLDAQHGNAKLVAATRDSQAAEDAVTSRRSVPPSVGS